MSSAKHADYTFQALADRLRARDDESLIAPKITADGHIDTSKHLNTYETLAMSDNKTLLGDPDGM